MSKGDLVSYDDSDPDSGASCDSYGYSTDRTRDRTERRVYIRERSRSRSPVGSRTVRRRSRSNERSPRREQRKEQHDWRTQAPSNTIMVTGLAVYSTEGDIRNNILQCGLVARDIRLIRKRETGAPRGFAFVEFATVQEAQRWMEARQGSFSLDDRVKVYLQYSVGRDGRVYLDNRGADQRVMYDWVCCKCSMANFKRRESCFRCGVPRDLVGIPADLAKEVSTHPTNVVMLRSLDSLVTEEDIIAKLAAISEVSSLSIKSARIGRDQVTKAHKGVCYLEMNNVMDAMKLYQALVSSPLIFDNKQAHVSYCRLDAGTSDSSTDMQAYSSGIHTDMHSSQMMAPNYDPHMDYNAAQIHSFAEYSARAYANTPEEYAYYYQYYHQHYSNSMQQQVQAAVSGSSTAASVAVQQAQALQASASQSLQPAASTGTSYIVNGAHVPPDMNRFQYEESSGFYYDPGTGLYFHPDSQYYYNDQKQQYLYWDAAQAKYVPVGEKQEEKQESKEEKKEKDDKQSAAKKIQKDMEKWAKKQRKEASRHATAQVAQAPPIDESKKQTSTADAAFAIMEKKEKSTVADVMKIYAMKQEEERRKEQGSSDDESATSDPHTDYIKKVCLLCKRQFPTLDALQKHQQLSSLHKENLDKWIANNPGFKFPGVNSQEYRDRARERREKFGDDETPQPNKLKEKFLAALESTSDAPSAPIATDNIGNKLLQKMGWQAGMGLGKTNQGRVDIIEADRRTQSAGLGVKSYGVTGSESYRDAVRKVARERFMELQD